LNVEVDGAEVTNPFDEVEKANTIYAFSPADFDRKSGRGRG
jgi:hypothetical protein